MKKAVSLLLTLFLALGLCTAAWAEGQVAVIDARSYDSLSAALEAAKSGDTVKLMEDVAVSGPSGNLYYVEDGVTLDLNGHSIDGSAISLGNANPAALGLNVAVQGSAGEITISNSSDTAATISGYVPLLVSSYFGDPLKVVIGGNIKLVATAGGEGNAVKLESNVYLLDSAEAESYFANGGFLAAVGGEKRIYCVFSSAADSASDTTAVLLNDCTSDQPISVNKYGNGNTQFTLDLNGKSYTYTGGGTYGIVNLNCGKSITVKNGKLLSKVSQQQAGVKLEASGAGVILDNVTVEAAGTYAIATNGSNTDNTVTLTNCTIKAPNGMGVYFPSTGKLTVNGGSIAAQTGIQLCAGSLEITGSPKITATGAGSDGTVGAGSVSDGAAVSIIANRSGYGAMGTVTIDSGEYVAANGVDALQTATVESGKKAEWTGTASAVTVSGGSYTTSDVEGFVKQADLTVANISANGTTTYYVGKSTVEAAAAAAPSGSTVTITRGEAALSNVSGGVTVKNTGDGNVTVNNVTVPAGDTGYTVPRTYYYYPAASTGDSKTTSPKTFDAGMGAYAVSALLSLTGMAWLGGRRTH